MENKIIKNSFKPEFIVKIARILILFELFELIFTQNSVEKKCMNKNNYAWSTEIQPSDCTSIDVSCCYINIFYKLPEIEVNDKYCFVNYIDVDKFIEELKKNLYNDIHRHIRREWSNHFKLNLIGSNLNYNLTETKTYWCPLNCTTPNITTLKCNEADFLPTPLDSMAQQVGDQFILEKNLPPNDINNCKNIEDDKCILFADTNNADNTNNEVVEVNNSGEEDPFSEFEKSLNLQYGFSKCFNPPCNSTDIERIQYEEQLFIGNKRLIKNKVDIVPESCKEIPPTLDEILRVNVICSENYVPTK